MEFLGMTNSQFTFRFSPPAACLYLTKGFVKETLAGKPGSFLHHTGSGEKSL